MTSPRRLCFPGTHRTISPEETLRRVTPLLPSLGITRVADVTGLDRIGIPVWTACRPNSRSLSVSQGKGITPDAARASAVMECIELHHAERPLVPLVLASRAELLARGMPTVDVSALAGSTTSRYHPERPLLWTEATDLLVGGERRWVPFETVHTNAVLPAPTGSGCFSSTSNGLASGNHVEEATVHALCEVIERDAAAVWQARPSEEREATAIDLTTVGDPTVGEVLDRYEAADIGVSVMEITSDVGVPAFLCEIVGRSEGVATRYSGMGCHLFPEIALLRALTEAAQSRLTYITGSRDDLSRREYRAARAGNVRSPEPGPSRRCCRRSFAEAPAAPTGSCTFMDDIDLIVRRLDRAGVTSVLTVDLTSPKYAIPVVRVIVPGLEGPDDEPTYVPGHRARAVNEKGIEL